jgi:hypothetical protein
MDTKTLDCPSGFGETTATTDREVSSSILNCLNLDMLHARKCCRKYVLALKILYLPKQSWLLHQNHCHQNEACAFSIEIITTYIVTKVSQGNPEKTWFSFTIVFHGFHSMKKCGIQ